MDIFSTPRSDRDERAAHAELKPHQYRPIRDARGHFLPGNPGSPGRGPGDRNKLAADFVADLHSAWLTHGRAAIERMVAENPTEFVKVVGKILPREFEARIDIGLDVADHVTRLRAYAEMLGVDLNPRHVGPHVPRDLTTKVIEHDDEAIPIDPFALGNGNG